MSIIVREKKTYSYIGEVVLTGTLDEIRMRLAAIEADFIVERRNVNA